MDIPHETFVNAKREALEPFRAIQWRYLLCYQYSLFVVLWVSFYDHVHSWLHGTDKPKNPFSKESVHLAHF